MDNITLRIEHNRFRKPSAAQTFSDEITREQYPSVFEELSENISEGTDESIAARGTTIDILGTDDFASITTGSARDMQRLLALNYVFLNIVRVKTSGGRNEWIDPREFDRGDVVEVSCWVPVSEITVLDSSSSDEGHDDSGSDNE
jgi:hypothetical protein